MSLCQTCATLDLSGDEEYYGAPLGRWDDVLTRSSEGCGGCQFFVDTLTTYVKDRGGSDVSAFFTEQHESMSRRYRDSTDFDPAKFQDDVRIDGMRILYRPAAMVSREGSSYTSDELSLEICTLDKEDGDSSKFDHRRDIPSNLNSEICYDLMKSWLDDCGSHGCQPQQAVALPKRVIQVEENPSSGCKIIEPQGQLGKFVALSHRWGDAEFLKLSTANQAQYLRDLPFEDLAQNCKDAITISRALGFRYLWIDALCVLQDDPSDRAKELANMQNYFLNCTLLLAADVAEDAQSGIFQDRLIQYSPPLGESRSRCFRPACLRWKNAVTESWLSGRAFAVQERILAPRILHFTQRQMMWECAHGWRLEAAHEIDKSMGAGQPTYNKALVQPLLSGTGVSAVASVDAAEKLYDAWFKSAEELSKATLTFPADKLRAISGVASALDNGSLGEYAAGIWTGALVPSLLWSRTFRLLTKPAEYRAPSWSWASLDGSLSMISKSAIASYLGKQSVWMEEHQPKLLETYLAHKDDSSPYLDFLPGSYIRLEGFCLDIMKLTGLSDTFSPRLVLDTSNAFDCHCCRPEREVTDTTGASEDTVLSYISLIVYGEGWDQGKGVVDTIILHPVKGEQDTYERVGMLRISFHRQDSEDESAARSQRKSVSEEFEEFGWKKRVLKLI